MFALYGTRTRSLSLHVKERARPRVAQERRQPAGLPASAWARASLTRPTARRKEAARGASPPHPPRLVPGETARDGARLRQEQRTAKQPGMGVKFNEITFFCESSLLRINQRHHGLRTRLWHTPPAAVKIFRAPCSVRAHTSCVPLGAFWSGLVGFARCFYSTLLKYLIYIYI